MIYSGPRAKIPAESDPYKMFDRIFGGGFQPPTPGMAPAPGAPDVGMERIRAEKKSILDFLTADLSDVRLKLGKDDGVKLDAHLESVRDIERRLQGDGGRARCSPPARPGGKPQMIDLNSNASLPGAAHRSPTRWWRRRSPATGPGSRRCSTRAASPTTSTPGWGPRTRTTRCRTAPANAPVLAKIQTFYMGHIAQLLDELKARPGGRQADAGQHAGGLRQRGLPGLDPRRVARALLVGGQAGRGGQAPGRFLDFAGTYDHNQMLQTMAQLMGVNVHKVGDLGKPGTIPPLMA